MAKRKTVDGDSESTAPPTVQEFIRLIRSGGFEKSDREKFRDFCEAGYCAYAKLTAPTPERADALEARYMGIVDSYRDKDYIRNAWPQLIAMGEGALTGTLPEVQPSHLPTLQGTRHERDFLGIIAGELNALDEDKGQFFTPYEVSLMMAKMNLDGMNEQIERDGYFTLGEPAVGSGSMVIAAADVLQFEMRRDPMVTMLVEAWDVSYLAYLMCYLHFCWRGITARVVRGNSLSMEIFEEAWTPFMHLFYSIHGSLFDKKPRRRTIETVIRDLIALERQAAAETAQPPADASVPVVEVEQELPALPEPEPLLQPEPESDPAPIPVDEEAEPEPEPMGKPVQLSLF